MAEEAGSLVAGKTGNVAESGAANVSLDKRGRWSLLLRWALAIGILCGLLWFIDVETALAAIAGANPFWLAVGLGANFIGTIFLPALITREAQHVQDARMSVARLVEINISNRFYILVLPRVAATAIRLVRYGDGRPTAAAFALLVFERGVQLATLMVLAAITLWLDRENLRDMRQALLWLVAAGSAVSLAALTPFFSSSIQSMALAVLDRMDGFLPTAVVQRLSNLVEAAALFRQTDHRSVGKMVALSLLASILFYLSAWFAAQSINLEISLLSLVWVRSVVFVATLIPLTIGGIGVREAGFVALLALLGVSAPAALAFSAVNFSFQVAIALAGAVSEAWRLNRRS